MLRPISEAPTNKRLLLYWETLDHYEDGTIYNNDDVPGETYTVLFDGESLNIPPTHWMEIPYAEISICR